MINKNNLEEIKEELKSIKVSKNKKIDIIVKIIWIVIVFFTGYIIFRYWL